MPIINTTQARVELTMSQFATIVELAVQFDEDGDRTVVGIAIEETNLPGVVAVMTAELHRRTFLVASDGKLQELGMPD